ncbi:hypothetical protein FOMPIDRAFT_1023783 [Fomitopsis schrenkii]|uniref:Uncharacterized protein n=1 Tax=Fomitopsis schrenkii TaxID=2126942 RepID=S8E5N8_FOMSC|nr:hypothetical protein FOMPIDRAFT_1023783 [Fomitopsis schrenkii]
MRSTTIISAAVIAASVAPALGFQFERRVRSYDEGELVARGGDEQEGRHGRGNPIARPPRPPAPGNGHGRGNPIVRPPAPPATGGHVRRPAPQGPGRRELHDEGLFSRGEHDDVEGRGHGHGRGQPVPRPPPPPPPSDGTHVRRPAPPPPQRPRELDDEGLFTRTSEDIEVYARNLWNWISPRLVSDQTSVSSPRELDEELLARAFAEDDLFARMDWEMDELD